MAMERMAAMGFTMPFPAMSGADPVCLLILCIYIYMGELERREVMEVAYRE